MFVNIVVVYLNMNKRIYSPFCYGSKVLNDMPGRDGGGYVPGKFVGADVTSGAPMPDPACVQGLKANRPFRERMPGITMRKQGLACPHYLSPLTKSHGQKKLSMLSARDRLRPGLGWRGRHVHLIAHSGDHTP